MVRQVQTVSSVSSSLAKLQEIIDSISVSAHTLKHEMPCIRADRPDNYPVFDPSLFWHGFPETLTVKR